MINAIKLHTAKNMALAERKRMIDEAIKEITADAVQQLMNHPAHEGHNDMMCQQFSDPLSAEMVIEQAFAPKAYFAQFDEKLWQAYCAAQRIVKLAEEKYGKETAEDLIFSGDFKHFCNAMFRNFAMTVQNNDMNKELGYIATAKHIGELLSEEHHKHIADNSRKAYLMNRLKKLYPQGEKAKDEMLAIVTELNTLK